MNPHILINNEEDDAVAFNGKMPISANPTKLPYKIVDGVPFSVDGK